MPPAGPVASTGRFGPRTDVATLPPGSPTAMHYISQSGSYYLSSNITGVSGKNGIEIGVSGVTLDLNGFDLVGVPGSLDGISIVVGGLRNIAVVNGSIRSWGGDGVDLSTTTTFNCRLTHLLVTDNTGNGISAGYACRISNCAASFNTGMGITSGFASTLSGCSAYANTGHGLDAKDGSAILNCAAYSNHLSGINTTTGSTVSNCSAYQNTGNGIVATSGCTISNCAVSGNDGNGISISASWGCIVTDCAARANALDGIVCASSSVIRGNSCEGNGRSISIGAGIHVTGDRNRIEGNHCVNADRGIDVDSTGNIIIKNTCLMNATNWDIVAGNAVAPIVQAATNAAAISGDTYAGSIGSTDPNANFTY